MYTIKTLNAISPAGLAKLPVNQFEVDNETTAPQGILVRSADMHDMPPTRRWPFRLTNPASVAAAQNALSMSPLGLVKVTFIMLR